MTSKERVLAAINHQMPDRLPITFDAEPEVIELLQNYFNVTSADEVWDALNVDTRLVGVNHNYHHIRPEKDNTRFDFWGIGQKKQPYHGGEYWEYFYHPLAEITTAEEVNAYDWPTADEISFEDLRATRAKYPDKAIIAHITHGGYFKSTHLRGMDFKKHISQITEQ